MSAKILWASQTGNCEAISLRLLEDCKNKNINCERYCLQQFGSELQISNQEVLLFVVSSTGDGELPDNGVKFYRWIRQQNGNLLSGVKYTILGLGDSNYSTYQGGPKSIERYLKTLGASEFYPRGEADEQMGLENTIEYWIDGLWDILKYQVDQLALKQTQVIQIEAANTKVIQSKVLEKKILSEKNSSKAIIELKLTINEPYTPGTAILVYPQNSKEKVNRILEYIKLSPDLIINSSDLPKSISHRCETSITLLDYFIKFVDIGSGLKTLTATYLSGLLENQSQKEDLLSCIDNTKISMPSAYNLECILSQYNSWGFINVPEFLEHLPILQGRNYSISSSPITSPECISIVFTVTGLCTRYLNSVSLSNIVEYTLPIDQGIFWKGVESSEKILMISTGTGLSPFKGILEHLVKTSPKPVWVIHGCRNSVRNTPEQNYDHIYLDEIRDLIKLCSGKITIANSRSPVGPKHIQDVFDEQAEEIRSWSNTAILCGSFKSKEVTRSLKEINPDFQVFSEEWE
jgi:sulfite reductase alpha subunit-like flavoprotein